jgi:AbrB family looped-hinge helix DNA binding protein
MELVTVKTKFQVVIPQSIRKRVGLDIGDLLEASFENGKLTFTPKTVIDRHLAEGIEDIARGRTPGPYESATEAISALERRAGGRNKENEEAEVKVRFTERADKDYAALPPGCAKRSQATRISAQSASTPFPAREEVRRGKSHWASAS